LSRSGCRAVECCKSVIVDTMKLISRLTLRVEWDVQDLGEEEGARKETL
jgi:hypothetical protein